MQEKMQLKIKKLERFVQKYGKDYLDDGTKARVVKSLENKNMNVALELLDSMDEAWIRRVKELGSFLVFTDIVSKHSNGFGEEPPMFLANYIDSVALKQQHIPVLRDIRIKEYFLNYNSNDGWYK